MRTGLIGMSLLAALTLAACGSGGSGKASGGAGQSGSSTSTSTSSTPASSTSGGGSGSAPAVSNATDLHKEPLPSAGSGTPPTSLVVKDLVTGTGAQPSASSSVEVQYVGANFADGKVFDSSWQRGQPATFPVNGVIPGFSQAILGMKVGGRREVVIPPALGYGSAGSPPAVGPNETLVFVIDLLAVH